MSSGAGSYRRLHSSGPAVAARRSNFYPRAPAIVIVSSELPDGSWRDVLAASQRLPSPPPVIVASRVADEHLWAEVLNLRGYDLIARPLDARELGWVVASALRQQTSTLKGDVQTGQRNTEEASCSAVLTNR